MLRHPSIEGKAPARSEATADAGIKSDTAEVVHRVGIYAKSMNDADDFLRDPASWPGDGDDFVFDPPGSGGYMGPDEWPSWSDKDRWVLTDPDAADAGKDVANG